MKQQEPILEYIVCPICGDKVKSMVNHVRYKHQLTTKQFRELYPNFGLMQIPNKPVDIICPICGKHFNSKSSFGTHYSYIHQHIKRNNKEDKRSKKLLNRKEGIVCKICGKLYLNIKQHVELSHNISWNDYKLKYNYSGSGKYFSEKTKQKLSINKNNFYNSSRGVEWKRMNGIRVSGDKNPSKRKEVREKISKKIIKRNNGNFQGYGINITFTRNNKKYHCCSFNEYIVLTSLLDNNIPVEYETYRIFYNYNGIKHLHITDFKIGNKIYELKPYSEISIIENRYKNYNKYYSIKQQLKNINIDFEVVNIKMILKKFNIPLKKLCLYRQYLLEHMDEVNKIQLCRSKNTYITFIETKNFDKFKSKINIIKF